jgi:hypothetical protein
MLSGFKSGKN